MPRGRTGASALAGKCPVSKRACSSFTTIAGVRLLSVTTTVTGEKSPERSPNGLGVTSAAHDGEHRVFLKFMVNDRHYLSESYRSRKYLYMQVFCLPLPDCGSREPRTGHETIGS